MRLENRYFAAAIIFGVFAAVYAIIERNESESLAVRNMTVYSGTVEVDACEDASANGWCAFFAHDGEGKMKVVMPSDASGDLPAPGELWEICGRLGRVERGRRKIWIKGSGTFARKTGETRFRSIAAMLAKIRRGLSRRAGFGLEEDRDIAALNRAMLLGERAKIDKSNREVFMAAGTIHIFAISGLHIMVIAAVAAAALALLWIPRRLIAVLLIPLLWLYTMMIGLPPSAVRASAMASFYLAARICGRKANALIAWSLAFIAIHLVSPAAILQVGSILSFAVMLGLILTSRYLAHFERIHAPWLWYPLAAWAAGTPIVAQIFGRITPGGIFANLILVAVAGADVAIGFCGMVAGLFSIHLARLLNALAALLTKLMFAVSWCVASVPGASVEIEEWRWTWTLAWYAAILFLAISFRKLHDWRKARI